jgi:hypothetical protein
VAEKKNLSILRAGRRNNGLAVFEPTSPVSKSPLKHYVAVLHRSGMNLSSNCPIICRVLLMLLMASLNAEAQCKRIEQNMPDFCITYEGAVTERARPRAKHIARRHYSDCETIRIA